MDKIIQSRIFVLIGIILCLSSVTVQGTKANFVPLPQEPPIDKPEISFTLPIQNQSILTKNELNLTFSVIIPSSWNNYLAPYYSPINKSIQKITILTSWNNQFALNTTESNQYSLHLQNIPKGNNTIAVNVNATVLYRLPTTGAFQYDEKNLFTSSAFNFEVGSIPPPIRFSYPNLIITGSIGILVGLGILAYFKKYRK